MKKWLPFVNKVSRKEQEEWEEYDWEHSEMWKKIKEEESDWDPSMYTDEEKKAREEMLSEPDDYVPMTPEQLKAFYKEYDAHEDYL